ncbi:FecCD family ABC transporter permease [Paucihalobacter ruber]|uniref:FecCD family ABC transporter permease n=1 Tax=Paucihalobacter ruber TaxID=2567861 RepID=UPI0037435F13
MGKITTYNKHFITLSLALIIVFFANISLGSVAIPITEVFKSLFHLSVENTAWNFIIQDYRLPKALTAVMVGSGLSVCGLLMQTLFRNPLAGPFVLGVSSGASLGVALLIMGAAGFGGILGTALLGTWSLVIAAGLGSFLVMLAVLAVTVRVKDTMAILIIGLMFGSVTAAIVGVLAYFSPAEQLQQYIFWSFGSLGNNSWEGMLVLFICFIAGLSMSIFTIKPLNALLLGENYAKSQGLNIAKSRLIILIATCILAGAVTAFAGPIAFIGLAVPHITRQIFTTASHHILIPAVTLSGAIIMLICDSIAQIPFTDYTLPINAITSLVGAPVVIWLLVRKRKLLF